VSSGWLSAMRMRTCRPGRNYGHCLTAEHFEEAALGELELSTACRAALDALAHLEEPIDISVPASDV
jgi:hypothetical protein